MGIELTIRGLREKRAALNVELKRWEAGAGDLRKQQQHINTTLAMFGIDTGSKKTIRERSRGENAQAIMDVLRTASRALTFAEIAQQVLVMRKLDPQDERLIRLMRQRVRDCLEIQRAKGSVERHEAISVERPLLTWSIVR